MDKELAFLKMAMSTKENSVMVCYMEKEHSNGRTKQYTRVSSEKMKSLEKGIIPGLTKALIKVMQLMVFDMDLEFTKIKKKTQSMKASGSMECVTVTVNSDTKMAQYIKVNGLKA